MNRSAENHKGRPRILFIHFNRSSFVREDLRILSTVGEIEEYHFSVNRNDTRFRLLFQIIIQFLKQLFWLIRHREADLVYCWFADYHSFLPVWFANHRRIPAITVLGGYDCNRLDKWKYGVFSSKWQKVFARYVIDHSSLLLPVDETLIHSRPIALHWAEAHPNGLAVNMKNFDTPYRVIPTGYDPNYWKMGELIRSKSACVVAGCKSIRTAYIKGLDLVIEVARILPEIPFTIVGISPRISSDFKKKMNPPDNVIFISPLPRSQLNEIYGTSSIYLQLSRAEGLPNTLCEAMMCGCIPIGSPVFGIPSGIGNCGLIADYPDPEHIAALITKVGEGNMESRKMARKRIADHFSLKKRAASLKEVLSEFNLI